jgi:hypothetical protein
VIPAWLTALAVAYLAIAFACAALLAYEVIRRPQPMAVMNVVWPITGLYLGPLAVRWYWDLARGQHAMRVVHRGMPERPFWKTIIIEATHCGAGCVLGDIIAEFGVYFGAVTLAGSRLVAEFAGDYVLAFVFGIAFQYFAIVPMRQLSFWPGLKAAIQADAISLTAFEVGLFAWMYVMSLSPFRASLTPLTPAFWFLMQIGMAIGYLTSYPANWFLVKIGIKEAM